MKVLQSSITPAELRLSAFISANAADVTTIPNGGWGVIAPYGDFKSPSGTYTQVFGRAEAEEIVKTWNSLTGHAARFFKNIVHGLGRKTSAPIWDGHPDQDRNRWPVEKCMGEVTDLRATANGLEGRITWNAAGLQSRTRGPLYPSPLWWHNPPAGTPPTVHPELLESVGLVPTPNIKSTPAWTENAALASESEADNQTQTSNTMDRKKLIELLGLAADATEEQITAALSGVKTTNNSLATANSAKAAAETNLANIQAQLTTANSTLTTITGERDSLKTANAALIDGLVNLAEARGAITPAERETYKGKFTANAAETVTELGKRKAMNTQPVEINGQRLDLSTPNARAEALEGILAETMRTANCNRNEAFAKVSRDTRYTALFGAMADPTKKTE